MHPLVDELIKRTCDALGTYAPAPEDPTCFPERFRGLMDALWGNVERNALHAAQPFPFYVAVFGPHEHLWRSYVLERLEPLLSACWTTETGVSRCVTTTAAALVPLLLRLGRAK